MRASIKRQVGLPAVALAAAALVTSCGLGLEGSATDDLSEAEKSRLAEDFRDCLAEGGLEGNVSFDGGINIDVGGGDDLDPETMRAVEVECEKLLEEIDTGQEIDPEDQARLLDASADIEACLAAEGYAVTIGDGGGINIDSDDQPAGFDEAEYLLVEEDCIRQAVPDLWEKYGEDG